MSRLSSARNTSEAASYIAEVLTEVIDDLVREIFDWLGEAETQLVYWGCPEFADRLSSMKIGGCRVSACVRALAIGGRVSALIALRQIGASVDIDDVLLHAAKHGRHSL